MKTLHQQLDEARQKRQALDALPPITQPGEARERCEQRAWWDSEIAALERAIQWNADMGREHAPEPMLDAEDRGLC